MSSLHVEEEKLASTTTCTTTRHPGSDKLTFMVKYPLSKKRWKLTDFYLV